LGKSAIEKWASSLRWWSLDLSGRVVVAQVGAVEVAVFSGGGGSFVVEEVAVAGKSFPIRSNNSRK